ncbi:hypothetical protein QO239_23645 [Cupriavidus taiwanensis]|uniref:hypothetical protein n=1 Tax=Cupriavidus taiwanensis TaxID=164546 RepID=UPI00253FDDB5|nr:hypothetical protein [Cupriavidus taiwanensis]MDK3025593.1 hypothetical protein [Cupriavidus taiwanensis]
MPENKGRSPDKSKVPTRDHQYDRWVPAKEDYNDRGGWYPGKGDAERIMPRDQLPPPPPMPRKKEG